MKNFKVLSLTAVVLVVEFIFHWALTLAVIFMVWVLTKPWGICL